MELRKLKREVVDDKKWDECVRQSPNGHVFAYTWYLDIVCEEWEAMVLNDYELIVPLPIQHRSFIKNVALPYWIPYLGVISKIPISESDVNTLLTQIPYLNVSLTLNAHNKLPPKEAIDVKLTKYVVLDLILSLERLKAKFSTDLNQVIDVYERQQISVIRSLNPKEYGDFLQQQSTVSDDQLGTLIKLISFALRYKSAGTYAAYNQRNEMIAEAFFVKSNSCLSLLHFATRHDDHDLLGPKAIVYHILKHNAESNLTMEFPYHSRLLGHFFSPNKHVCYMYRKGWMQ